MHTPLQIFSILAAVAHLTGLSLGTWAPGKAAQIDFYDGGSCATLTAGASSWWTKSPFVGGPGAETGAECFLLDMPLNSTGITNTMMWAESTTSDTIEPALAKGWCTYWDGFNCTGTELPITYNPSEAEEGPCEPGRSKDVLLWKSARCFIDVPTTTASSQVLILPSTSSSSSTVSISASSTSLSASPQPSALATRKALSSAAIAGVITGAVSLLVAAILLVFCIRRRSRRKPDAVLPYPMSEQRDPEAQNKAPPPRLWEKFRTSEAGASQPTTPVERRLHQSVVASELRALREEVERLNSAMGNGDGNDARIRALQRELQSYADAERLDPSLPGYLD
ncbi:hypothetical protein MSAN_00973900 [Mycena sanguinolenta]|uniref:Uncharacterized protein n=1 Tax=Mycena sanguinolenta TaxID=230812 RepID=A0A8H6YXQ5_9AGAR|nr:hypothetical protein MSAN_00973900 [Mycena sanguinolenta]